MATAVGMRLPERGGNAYNVLLGLSPGPHMVRQDLSTTYTIVRSLAQAIVIGAGLCIVLPKYIARLTTIRFTLLAPYLFMIIALGYTPLRIGPPPGAGTSLSGSAICRTASV